MGKIQAAVSYMWVLTVPVRALKVFTFFVSQAVLPLT